MAIADGEKLRFAESRNERTGIELAAGGEGQGPERGGLREDDVVDELPAVPLALEEGRDGQTRAVGTLPVAMTPGGRTGAPR